MASTIKERAVVDRRWYYVTMVAGAIAISYFDRQTISVAISTIQRTIPISQQQFSYLSTAFLLAYAAMYAGGGRLLDRIGTRHGFLLIMLWWSAACALHGLATGFTWLVAMRFLLGMGEGGAFPAATRVVSEWVPARARSTAMGFINAGTAIGSLLAPPLIGFVILHSGWRAVFFTAGAIGFMWTVWWAVSYRSKTASSSTNVSKGQTENVFSFTEIIGIRQVQMLVFAKFMSDSAWFFLLFWLPKYLYDARGFDVKQVSYFAWIPYAASGVGSFLGGWASSQLLRSGKSLDASRKWVLGTNALMMTAVMLVTHVPVGYAIALFSVAFFAQQSWSGIIMTIPADVFPLSAVGTVAGLVGFGGSMGGAIFGLIVGWLLQHGVSYSVLFTVVGLFHLTGFIVFSTAGGRIKPLQPNPLIEIGSRA
ncbi:MAG TPA: MFS transporter [Terriglobales bacterium]|jgi:ACS family hexuronate transporter-like MFS transporter